jgi:hypothetical protein
LNDLYDKVPVSVLRTKYSASDVNNFQHTHPEFTPPEFHQAYEIFWSISEIETGPQSFALGWKLELFGWLFDECQLPVSAHVMEGGENGYGEFGTVLDFVVFMILSPCRAPLMKFLLERGAKSEKTLGYLLLFCKTSDEVQLLLDAGAEPDPTHLDPLPPWIIQLYVSRQAARAAIYAVLTAAKRRSGLRGLVARELWRWIAEMVWSKRWEFQ